MVTARVAPAPKASVAAVATAAAAASIGNISFTSIIFNTLLNYLTSIISCFFYQSFPSPLIFSELFLHHAPKDVSNNTTEHKHHLAFTIKHQLLPQDIAQNVSQNITEHLYHLSFIKHFTTKIETSSIYLLNTSQTSSAN